MRYISAYLRTWTVFAVVSLGLMLSACGGGGGTNTGGGNTVIPPTSDPNKKFTLDAHTFSSSVPVVLADGTRAVILYEAVSGQYGFLISSYDEMTSSWSTVQPLYSQVFQIEYFNAFNSSDGSVHFVWLQYGMIGINNVRAIYTSSYSQSNGWSNPELITSFNSDPGSEIKIVRNSLNDGVILWTQREALNFGYFHIWSSNFTTTDGWGAPQLRDGNTYDAKQIQLGIDDAGQVTAIWNRGGSIHYSHYQTDWSSPQLLSSSGDQLSSAFNQNGDIVVAWYQQNNFNHLNTYASRYTKASGWTTPGEIMDINSDVSNVRSPKVAISATGAPIVVWQEPGVGDSESLHAARYTQEDGWSYGLVNQAVFFDSMSSVKVVSGGNAVWFGRQNNTDIVAIPFSTTTGWGEKSTLYSASSGAVFSPIAVISDSGAGLLSWSEYSNNTYSVYARILP